MRKSTVSVETIKQQVTDLVGKSVKVSVNRGRNKVVRYKANVKGVYPAVFVLEILNCKSLRSMSCSYNDLICGDIKISPEKKIAESSAEKTQTV